MINNICESNKSTQSATAFKATTTTAAAIVDNRHNDGDEANDVASTNTNNSSNSRGGVVQTTYGHGIWYSEIIDGARNTNKNNNKIFHQQQYYNNANSSSNFNSSHNNNNKENIVNRNVWLTTRCDVVKEQQKQQQSHNNNTTNECDIVIVDIEDDDDNAEVERLQQQPIYSVPQKFFMNANMQFSKQKQPATIYDSKRCVAAKNNITGNVNASNPMHIANDDHVDVNENDRIAEDDDDDSLASMETLSDNVSIWIGGEKHWVAGVDANTTCSDLIWALLNYQNGQLPSQQQTQHPHVFAIATSLPSTNGENIAATVINKTNSNQCEKHVLQQQRHQQQPKTYDNNDLDFSFSMSTNEGSSNLCTDNKPNIQNTANTNNTSNPTTITSSSTIITTTINQSMPINTKENCKIIQNSTLVTAEAPAVTVTSAAATATLSATPIISSSAPVPAIPPTLLPITLPPGITTVSQLATEYVIVKQYHHCEEYLDGSTKVFDVLPRRDGSHKKECELLLRHLGPAPAVYINNTTPQLSSLISTDKDSGMGSPVGSARSAKFRRRKHKSSQWLAQANTLHPKLSRCTGNERLMKIILAQDETIQRQLSLLREKERQITKIEEEKHRKRERELGKNYLLETYLNGLDEAECEPEIQDGEEIFIDEPYHRTATATTLLIPNPRTTITPTGAKLAAGAVTDKIPSATEAFNMMARHKLKDKEVKKEKKKKRHKDKFTKDEVIPAKDFNLKTNKNKDKEKLDKQQKEQQHELNELKAIDGNGNKDNGNEQEIEMQILWLEKIYTLNKQLQKEEELAAKLHAKVRKHQLRMAQQTQHEAQMEIDKLDNNLALQCGDIRKVEANLMQTNEQLQKKLLILERLSMEYLQEQQENASVIKDNNEQQADQITTTKPIENPLKNDANTLLTNLEKSIDIQKLSLNNIKSKEQVIKLEKIIAKPSLELRATKIEHKEPKPAASASIANNPLRINMKTTVLPPTNQPRFSNEIRANSMNDTSNSTNRNVFVTTTNNQPQQQQHPQQPATTSTPTTSVSVTAHTLSSEAALSHSTVSTSCMFIDKNMLSSLHVQNAKTIKKQMFHTQTTSATAALTGKIPATSISSHLLPPPPPLSLLPPLSSAFPKQQFQHIFHQQQQHMPMASTFLTSRPQNSHQIPATNIVLVQQPSTASSSFSCSSNFTTSSSSSPLSSSSLTAASAAATVSALKASQPPTSASPSPSIMAMNTVDISQLGTLV
ncbi:uncharacterized protein LOC135955457 [Calliphora vicina]|uniref:uncharacterized protein LOC135955457 n=1 Tax=Calliphora vicina TaxID=7373 RepID=UPI00325A8F78